MTVTRFVFFTVLTLAAAGILYAVQIPLRRKARLRARWIVWIIKVLLMSALAFALIAVASPFLWRFDYPLAAVYLALLGDVTAEFFDLVFRKHKLFPYLLCLCTAAHLGYSMWNMGTIRPVYHTYQSEKLKEPCRIVFLSDLHYGSSQSAETVTAALNKIKAEQPDYLILGGDITDEHTTNEEMRSLYAEIGNLGIDTYYIYGNHDRQDRASYLGGPDYSEDELKDAIESNGITILYNETVQPRKDLILYGSEDPSRPQDFIPADEVPEFTNDAYSIYIVHTPPHGKEPIARADLELSGHIHAGQFFPVRLIYTLAGLHVKGEYSVGDTVLLVSPGIAGWYLPLRNESVCSYEVIDLQPE